MIQEKVPVEISKPSMEPTWDPKKTTCLWFWNPFIVGFLGYLGFCFRSLLKVSWKLVSMILKCNRMIRLL